MTDERLARIIRIKERLRNARRAELASARSAEDAAEDARRASRAGLERQRAAYTGAREIDARELAVQAWLVAAAEAREKQAEDALREASGIREICADALVGAAREVQGLERLADRREADRARERARQEQRLMDEAAQRGAR